MNEKRSFDAVLSHLTNRLNSRGEGSERNELEQVIRVLEVAGRVDKARCVFWICGLGLDATNKRAAKAYNQIRDLLDTLLDKPEQAKE